MKPVSLSLRLSALASFFLLTSFYKQWGALTKLIPLKWANCVQLTSLMQQPLQVNHPGKPLSDSYALIAYQTVPINLDGSKSTHSICMGMRHSVEKLWVLTEGNLQQSDCGIQ